MRDKLRSAEADYLQSHRLILFTINHSNLGILVGPMEIIAILVGKVDAVQRLLTYLSSSEYLDVLFSKIVLVKVGSTRKYDLAALAAIPRQGSIDQGFVTPRLENCYLSTTTLQAQLPRSKCGWPLLQPTNYFSTTISE